MRRKRHKRPFAERTFEHRECGPETRGLEIVFGGMFACLCLRISRGAPYAKSTGHRPARGACALQQVFSGPNLLISNFQLADFSFGDVLLSDNRTALPGSEKWVVY